MFSKRLLRPRIVVHHGLVGTLSDTTTTRHIVEDTVAPGGALTGVRFTFEVDAGALRRSSTTVLTRRLVDAGLDVSWNDRRSGLFGLTRRFTVEGSSRLIGKLISELAETIGWQPGAIALPTL